METGTFDLLRAIARHHPYAASLTNHVELAGTIYPVRFPEPYTVLWSCGEVSPLWGEPLADTLALWRAMLSAGDYLSVLGRLGSPADPLGPRELFAGAQLMLSFYRDQARTDGPGPHAP